MITCSAINYRAKANVKADVSLGNRLFRIAGVIGIATKNGYEYGFPMWWQQEFFTNPLPVFEGQLKKQRLPANYKGYDFGFMGFNFRDGADYDSEFGSWKYFEHCSDLIKHYFTLIQQCEPFKDKILIHYRNYKQDGWNKLKSDYYDKALSLFPQKETIVITDDIEAAFNTLGSGHVYCSSTPIVDFYLLCNTDYLVMANSTFSWWAAYLSGAKTVAPLNWYAGELKDAPLGDDFYLPQWTVI